MIQEHPNIVKVHANLESQQYFYIILEYHNPPTCTLQDYIDCFTENYASPEFAITVFVQLVSAIAFMHRQDIAHRDLKPDNILVHPETFHVTIIDFGFACTDHISSDALGSPLYMCPEMLSGKEYDPKLEDSWALGVILYSLLFGSHPLHAKSLAELSVAAAEEQIHIPKSYPHWGLGEGKEVDPIVKEILEELLQKESEKRMSVINLEKKLLEKDILYLVKDKPQMLSVVIKTLERCDNQEDSL
eukprot:TRINITY_DN5643_c1_g1_i1.p1 TRINITY_DN5643_c1_g1~~TRINITY_DN5643_c1_g1_i1.p1  ORF type:complete len:245 (+),score=47.66 TRINITY_DN5643_c1_g1_i1:477-1211(+)